MQVDTINNFFSIYSIQDYFFSFETYCSANEVTDSTN